jgi:glutaryl-CoA dehydrogenase
MGELGLLGPTIPEAYGGAGLNYVCYGLMAREVERVDSGYRSMMSVQSSLVMVPINEFGNEAHQAEVPAQAGHRRVDRLLRPDRAQPRLRPRQHGHPRPRSTAATASRAKMWITNSPIADVFVVWAKDDGGQIRGFVLEKGWKGLSAPAIHGKVGLRASITGEIVMDEVFCARRERLPRRARPQGPVHLPQLARYGIAWGALGAAEFCWHTRAPVHAGPQAVRPPAGRQPADPEEAGRHADRDHLGLQGCLRLGRMKDEGTAAVEITSIMKRNSCGKALDIARMARDMLGGNGISDEFGVIRHLVNLEVVNTYEGTHDVHALILGRAITGIRDLIAGDELSRDRAAAQFWVPLRAPSRVLCRLHSRYLVSPALGLHRNDVMASVFVQSDIKLVYLNLANTLDAGSQVVLQ